MSDFAQHYPTDGIRGESAVSLNQAGALFDHCAVPCWIVQQNRILYANPAALGALGASVREQVAGHALVEFVALPFRSRIQDRIAAVLNTGAASRGIEKQLLRLDGKEFTAEVNTWRIELTSGPAAQITFSNVEERYETERALRASEERFRQTFEHAHTGMALLGGDYQFLRVNAALCRMLDYAEDELTRMSFVEVTHPDDFDVECDGMQQLLEGKSESFSAEVRYITRSARVFWAHVTRSVVKDADGKPLHVLLIVEDIDYRKQMESRLIESEERLRLAMQGAQIGCFDWDIPSGWVRWSTNLQKLTGVATENGLIQFANFQKLVHPGDAERVRLALNDAFVTGRYQCEFRMVLPDGGTRCVDARGTVHFDEQGKPLRLLGVDIEITARKQMERDLQATVSVLREAESRARARGDELAAILDSVPALTFIAHDPECRTMTSSRAAHEFLQVPPGHNTSKTAALDERPKTFKVLRGDIEVAGEELPVQVAARTGREVRNAELTLLFEDGTRREICGHAVPLFGANGQSRGAVGAFIDITPRKRAEEALYESEERLRLLIEHAPVGLAMFDTDARYLCTSRRYREICLLGDRSLEGLSYYDLFPERAQACREAMKQALQGQSVRGESEPGEPPTALHSPVLWEFRPWTRSNGEVGGVVLFVTSKPDATGAEEQLRLAGERFETALRGSKIVVFHQDLDLRYTWIYNPALGYDIPEVIGKRDRDLFERAEDSAATETMKMEVIRSGQGQRKEVIIRHQGVDRFYDLQVDPLLDAAGKIAGVTCAAMDVTEQKHAQQQLYEAKERAELACRVANMGEWEVDLATGTGRQSALSAEIFGYTQPVADWSLEHFLSHVEPEDRDTTERKVRGCVECGSSDFEVRIRRVDGEQRWIWVRGALMGESPSKMAGTVMDITDRKRVDEALRENARLLALALEAGQSGFFDWDLMRGISHWSPELERIYGVEPGVYRGSLEQWREWVVAEDLPVAERCGEEAMRTGRLSGEWRIIRQSDREIRWLSGCGIVLRDDFGTPVRLVGINVDITERKRIETRLRESEERLRSVLESMSEGLMLFDARGDLVYQNPASVRIHGFEPGEEHRRQERKLLEATWKGWDESGAVLSTDGWPMSRILRGERFQNQILHVQRFETGYEFDASYNGSPLYDSSGNLTGGFITIRDVTDQRRAQLAVLRTEKLASMGRLAATIAHEINNPLAAVTNLLYVVQASEDLPEAARHYLEIADAELKRVAHVTRQSLGFYREFNAPAATSLKAVLESSVDLLKSKINAKHAVIETKWDRELEITAVAGELRQVFSNLLANSLDAIDDGGLIQLRVSVGGSPEDGERVVRVTVADNGRGILPASRQHIFEPFFTTKGTVGTGLGLWVCKQIVEKHGGTIQLRSSTDQKHRGTVCSIILPVGKTVLVQQQALP